MQLMKRSMTTLVAAALFAGAAPNAVAQETWPARPVTAVVPFPAGQGVDAMARALAGELARITGQPFPVVNREGAAATIGFASVVRSKPDGYTIAISPNTPLTIAPHLLKSVPYGFDAAIPVCQSFENVMAVFTGPQSPHRTLQSLLDAARASGGTATWGSSGIGSVPHLSAAGLLQAAGLSLTHVPYRGEPQILQQLLAGEILFASASVSGMSGRNVRALAVFSSERHPAYPDVPALGELGLPPGVPGLNGIFVPRGTPEPVVAALEKACAEATASEGFRAFAAKLHQRVAFLGRTAFERRLRADYDEKAALIKSLALQPE
jgi:tripartite-type tricarboxylate transporter receptor subunit TctC